MENKTTYHLHFTFLLFYLAADEHICYCACMSTIKLQGCLPDKQSGNPIIRQIKVQTMNGRVYDPLTASFLSPDNYVQMPDYTPGFNRYSYCLNNPLIYTDPSGEFIFTALLAPIGLAPLGVIIDGACWSAAIDAGIQGVRIETGQQEQFNWAELGGAAVGGAVFAGMGLIAPSFSVTSTSFMTNLPKYAGKAGWAALTGAASTGAGMFASDMFDNGQLDYSGEEYLKAMGTAGLISGGLSFASSMYDYGTWDRLSTADKMAKIQNKFGSNVRYSATQVDAGAYGPGNSYVTLGPAALDKGKGYAFSSARHELKHLSDWNKYTAGNLNIPARRGSGFTGIRNHFEIRAYKLEMRYPGVTTKYHLEYLNFIRDNHGYKGFGTFSPNPFMYFNSIF